MVHNAPTPVHPNRDPTAPSTSATQNPSGGRIPLWHSIKPSDDSPDWLADQDGRKPFSFYFGPHERGRKNRAALAHIKCKHHQFLGPRGRTQAGICADYIADGRCKPNCSLTHFLAGKAEKYAGGSPERGRHLAKSVGAALASIYSA